MRKILSDYKVTLHSVTEPIGNNPMEKFMETLLAASAEFDNSIRKARCIGGMLAKLKQGIWPWKPPVDYACQYAKRRNEKKLNPDNPDPVTFPIIQNALKEYSKGLYNQADIARMLQKDGLHRILGNEKISLQVINKILGKQLPFYAGLLVNPWAGPSGEDRFIPGLHTPMITEQEMYKIIQVRSGKKDKNRFKWDRQNPLFPLRRTVLCMSCKKPLTGSSPKGNGGIYNYYHCFASGCEMKGKIIAKDILETDFVKHLKSITPTDTFLLIFKETVLDHWEEQGASFKLKAEQYRAHLEGLEKQRKQIYEMREDGSYTAEEFKERKEEINNKIATAQISYSEARIEQFDLESVLNYASDQISDLPRLWEELNPELKSRFQKLVFPEGIPYSRKNRFRTKEKVKLGCIYELGKRSIASKTTGVDFDMVFVNQIAKEMEYLVWVLKGDYGKV